MNHLGQSSTPSGLREFPLRIPVQFAASPSETSSLWRFAARQERMPVELKSFSTGQFETAHLGGLSTHSAGARRVMELKTIPPSEASGPITNIGSQSGASLFGQFPAGHIANVSSEAVRFAKEHRLWGSLVAIKSLVSGAGSPVVAIDVDLVSDPDVKGTPVICFALRSSAPLPNLLDYDERLTGLVCDQIPAADRPYFAIRFELN